MWGWGFGPFPMSFTTGRRMTTYRQVLNQVLEKLGEDLVADAVDTLSSAYHILVGSFVNDVKEQIEDAHNWRALRQFISVTAPADDLNATITGANERSRLLRIFNAQYCAVIPMVFDITDATNPVPLRELDLTELIYRDKVDPTTRASESPEYFAIDNSAGDVLSLYVWPRPSSERTISLGLIIPQDRLEYDDLDTVIKIPVRPLSVGTTWYALEERGEELGVNGIFSEQRFQDALNSAISRDSAEQGDSFELVIV
jgi:hypothetical protein